MATAVLGALTAEWNEGWQRHSGNGAEVFSQALPGSRTEVELGGGTDEDIIHLNNRL